MADLSILKNLTETLGINNLGEEEQRKILDMVDSFLEETVLTTFIKELSPEETEEVRKILAESKNIEDKIARVSARIPGLAQKMEAAAAEEINRLKKVIQA